MPTQKFSAEILNAAIDGFEAQKKHIDDQIAEIRLLLDGRPAQASPAETAVPRKKRRLSAAGRKAIAEAARRRWAAVKAAGKPEAALKGASKKSAAKKSAARKRARKAANPTEQTAG